ncbi:MAG: response regulator, partial [Solirubrobacteraceae bacterium]
LVVNARDAMVNGGVLTIETANVQLDAMYASRYPTVRPGAYVMLAVTDTGTGIAPGDLERIFEPFFTTKESGKGTGLGLSTVLGIVEQSGGHISVYSEAGRGSSFKVYLPRVDAAEPALEAAMQDPASRVGSETILLVEDDPAVRAVAAAVLRRVGYTIIETENGVEALRVCQDPAAAFDLVLSDMVMPGLGGRALAGHVQRIRPQVPVLLMSGYTRDAMLHNAEIGAGNLFVEKPFTPEALTQKVRDAIDRGRRAS